MKFISPITWNEVFAAWREREGNDPSWIKVATEVKGWPDWESWRQFTVSQLGLAHLSWELHEFTEPMEQIPAMLLGPYTGWQGRVPGEKNRASFSDLVAVPEQLEYWRGIDKIQAMIEEFPSDAGMVGVIRPDNGKIVCIEGHHRATAVAVAKQLGLPVSFPGSMHIAVARLPESGPATLDATLARGSSYKA